MNHPIVQWFLSTFDNYTKGASGRKITAFAITACVIAMHSAYIYHLFNKYDFSLFPEVLIIDFGFIAALFGLTTYQNMKRNATPDNTTDKG